MRNGYLASSIHCKGHTMAGLADFLLEIVMVCFVISLAKHVSFKSKHLHFFLLIFPVDLQFRSGFRFASTSIQTTCLEL